MESRPSKSQPPEVRLQHPQIHRCLSHRFQRTRIYPYGLSQIFQNLCWPSATLIGQINALPNTPPTRMLPPVLTAESNNTATRVSTASRRRSRSCRTPRPQQFRLKRQLQVQGLILQIIRFLS